MLPLWCLGQVARDATWLTGLCFYIPSAVLVVVLLGWSVVHITRRRHFPAALAACLALPPLGSVLLVENHLFGHRAPLASAQVRLVHWNVGGALGHRTQHVLRDQRADLYVLSEVPDYSVEEFRASLGMEYGAQVFGNLAAVGTGEIRANGWLLNRGRAKVQSVTWRRAGRETALLVVDLPSEIHVARDRLLREVNWLIERQRPDLVVGDFNAPRRSRGLCELPAGYRHAYDTAGSGFGYTWPVPVPVYALDHCLHSLRVKPARYELRSSCYSDHCLQLFDFAWSDQE